MLRPIISYSPLLLLDAKVNHSMNNAIKFINKKRAPFNHGTLFSDEKTIY